MKLQASRGVAIKAFLYGVEIEHSDSRTATTCQP